MSVPSERGFGWLCPPRGSLSCLERSTGETPGLGNLRDNGTLCSGSQRPGSRAVALPWDGLGVERPDRRGHPRPRSPGDRTAPFRPSVVRSTAAPRLPHSPLPGAHNKAIPGPGANPATRKNSFAPSFLQPWQPGLTTPSRRAADSQPPSYHPTTAAARAAGNFRSPRHRPLEWA